MKENSLINILLEGYENIPSYLKDYIKSGYISYLLGKESELRSLYPSKEDLIVYRGLNFSSEKDYNEFLKQVDIKNKKYINPRISSWTTDYKIANGFARTIKAYTEFLSIADVKEIQKQENEYNRITGYKGVVLEIKIPARKAIDITDESVEDEILVLKGEYDLQNIKMIDNFNDMFNNIKTEKQVISILDELDDENMKEFTNCVKWLNKNKKELLTKNVLNYIFKRNYNLIYFISDTNTYFKHKFFLKLMKLFKEKDEKYYIHFPLSRLNTFIIVFIINPDKYFDFLLPEDKEKYFSFIRPYVKKMIDEVSDFYSKNIDKYLRIKWENHYLYTILVGTRLYDYYQKKIGSLLSKNYHDITRNLQKPFNQEEMQKIVNRTNDTVQSMNLGESVKTAK